MRSVIRSSRLSVEEPIPLKKSGSGSSIAILYVLFSAATVWLIIAGVSAHGTMNRAHLILFGVFFLTLVLYMRSYMSAASPRQVRVVDGDGLTFVHPRVLSVMPYALGVTAILPGLVSLLAPALTGEAFGLSDSHHLSDMKLGVLMFLGVFAVGQQVWSLRLPVGLKVSEWGLMGVRVSSKKVNLPWDNVECVEVVESRSGARLRIMSTEYDTYVYQPFEIGSDPNVVAAIIEHFRENPKDRVALSNADEAIRLVETAEDH